MNIFNIERELISIFDELEENGGELTEELAAKLEVTQDNFKNKVKSYADLIKTIEEDNILIDKEIKRLQDLKKSKTSLITRLSNIIINAIENFGDINKSGNKYIDYGLGKITIRNTEKVETDDEKLNVIAEEFSRAIAFEVVMGGGSNRETITPEELIQRCKEHKIYNLDVVADDPCDVTSEDIMNTVVEITTKQPIRKLIDEKGYSVIKNLMSFDSAISVSPKVDKNALKQELKENDNNISIAEIVTNKTLNIK